MEKLVAGRRPFWLEASVLMLLAVPFQACSDGPPAPSSEAPTAVDSTPLPPDTTTPPPPDTTTPPPPDTTTPPPPDTTTPPPPDTTANVLCPFPDGSSGTPHHAGIAFGPTHVPSPKLGGTFTGTQITATNVSCLLADLERARRSNARVFVSFTGNSQWNRDEDGFSLEKWQRRVDRFRNADLAPYIADGTILGHLLMDEPNDPHEWNGNVVSPADIEAMAKYSKAVWPTMTTYVRTFPDYLEGGQFPHLDAIWFQYLDRWAPLDEFIERHFQEAKSLGLKVVTGLNAINGGSKSSGIPGRRQGKNAMSADELRSWGKELLAQPNLCGFLIWEWDEPYLSRPDIKAALEDLSAAASAYPTNDCGR